MNWIACPFQQVIVHSFSHSILLSSIAYSTLSCYAFISTKFSRIEFQAIVTPKMLYCLTCLTLHKNLPMLEKFENFKYLLHHEYSFHPRVIIDDGKEIPCSSQWWNSWKPPVVRMDVIQHGFCCVHNFWERRLMLLPIDTIHTKLKSFHLVISKKTSLPYNMQTFFTHVAQPQMP